MRAGVTPEAVVAAAAELADRDGWEQVTLGSVAAKLGIRTPSLYNHVEGLPELRRKLAAHGAAELRGRLFDAAAGLSGEQAVLAVSLSYIDFVRERPGLYEAINRAAAPQLAEFAQSSEQIIGLFIRLLQPLELSEQEAVHAIRGVRSMVHGFASLQAMGGFQMSADLNESIRKSISYYWQGLQQDISK